MCSAQLAWIDFVGYTAGSPPPRPTPGPTPPGPVDPGYGIPIERPTHPIVIPPDAIGPGVPTHPIYLPVYPAHPIVIPPGSLAPGVPTHPIYLPVYPAHPIVIPGDHGPTFIEEEMRQNKDAERKPGNWVVGSVQNKSLEVPQEFDLMV